MSHLLAAFPYPTMDPVLFRLGPLVIRWYGLAYVASFLLGYMGLKRMILSERLRVSEGELSNLLPWLVTAVLVGGRLGWWIFYHRGEGAAEPWYEPFAIWHGGMSFHGGLVGVATAIVFWSWRNRAPLLNIADCIALVTPLGLFFGRIANFINAELVGRPTSLPWGVIFPGELFARHPSQLYEALFEGPLLFAIIWTFSSRRCRHDGRTAAMFLIFYGVVRFLVEFARQPDEQLGFIAFGWLTMGQLLSLALSLAGALFSLGISVSRSRRSGSHFTSASQR